MGLSAVENSTITSSPLSSTSTLPAAELAPSATEKTIVEERVDENGRRVRVTRKIRLRLVSERVRPEVAARRAWRKFGDAAADGPGPHLSSTIIGEPVFLKLSLTGGAAENEPAKAAVVQAKNIVCRYCQGAHWSAKCPFKSTFAEEAREAEGGSGKDEGAGPKKYIPPSMRRAMEAAAESGIPMATTSQRDNPNTVRISNLADVVTEADLRDLVGRISQPARVYVVKDQRTMLCRGSAFVSFHTIEDAERVVAKLHAHKYGNLVLHVEMAKPQAP